MKGSKTNPRYSRQVVRKEIARRLKAERERDQLRAQLESIHLDAKRAAGNIEKIAIGALGALHGER